MGMDFFLFIQIKVNLYYNSDSVSFGIYAPHSAVGWRLAVRTSLCKALQNSTMAPRRTNYTERGFE